MSARILFVCTGNICRSPTAHALLAQKAQTAGLAALVVDSAGISDEEEGHLMDRRSARELALRGYAPLVHHARQVVPADFVQFDWIIGMTGAHCGALLRQRAQLEKGHCNAATHVGDAPPARAAGPRLAGIALMRDCLENQAKGQDVPDPWYGGPQDFVRVFDMLDACVEALLAQLEAAAAQSRRLALPTYPQ